MPAAKRSTAAAMSTGPGRLRRNQSVPRAAVWRTVPSMMLWRSAPICRVRSSSSPSSGTRPKASRAMM